MRDVTYYACRGSSVMLALLVLCLMLPLPVEARSRTHHPRTNHRSYSAKGSRTALQRQMTDGSLLDDYDSAEEASPLTENLWGSWLLQCAMQRDPAIKDLIKKLNGTETLSNTLITGVVLLGIAESIDAIADTKTQAPNIMGVVGSSVPVATLGVHAWRVNHLKHAMQKRQSVIEDALTDIMDDLDDTQDMKSAYEALVPWVGERASQQFLSLWRVTNVPVDFLTDTPAAAPAESDLDLSPTTLKAVH